MPLPFKRVRYLWEYEGNVRHIITTMKYRPSYKLANFISEIMAESLPYLFHIETGSLTWDLVIPVPSSKQSKSRRMFNQCSLLSLAVMRRYGLAQTDAFGRVPWSTALKHQGYTVQQAAIKGADKRISNVRRAFISSAKEVKGKAVLLVDDVVTSGATSLAAASALIQAGAKSVDLLMLARHRSWKQHRYQMYKKFVKGSTLQ